MPNPVRTGRRVTLRMVADEAGVSIATVSYVLSGRSGGTAGISEPTIQRVKATATKLNYRPNQAARTIRTGKTNLVLISLTMLSDPWSQAVAQAVNDAVTPHGLTALILADQDWSRVLDRQAADAVFIDWTQDEPEKLERLNRLAEQGTPLVVFDESLEPTSFDVVRSVAFPGCELAVRHLLRDHTQIACLTGSATVSDGHPTRFSAYRDQMARAGLDVPENYVETFEHDATSAFVAATKLLSVKDRPTAIYATTDFAAISAINAAQRLRLRVPEDVAVIGVGNTLEGERMLPTLSTVGPTDFYARLAEILRRRATGEDTAPPTLHEFPWTVFARDSTKINTNQ